MSGLRKVGTLYREVVQVPECRDQYNAAKDQAERETGDLPVFVYRLGPTWFAVSLRVR